MMGSDNSVPNGLRAIVEAAHQLANTHRLDGKFPSEFAGESSSRLRKQIDKILPDVGGEISHRLQALRSACQTIHRWATAPRPVLAAQRFRKTLPAIPSADDVAFLVAELNRHVSEQIASGGEAQQAQVEKLFPKGLPKNSDICDVVLLLQTTRNQENTDREIIREFYGENANSCPKTKRMESKLRWMRNEGKLSLPGRNPERR